MATLTTTTNRDLLNGQLCKSITATDTTTYGQNNVLPLEKWKMRTFFLKDFVSGAVLDVKTSDMQTPSVDFEISLLDAGTSNVIIGLFVSRSDIPGGDDTFRQHPIDCILPQGI